MTMTVQEQTNEIRGALRAHIAEVLYVEPDEVGEDTAFRDLGLDSVLGVELIGTINREYGLKEEADVLYQHSTLSELTTYIAGKTAQEDS
ncbi:polyketide synthase PksL [Nonomuraea solani]|uniref:Polyketide synthase PksL n=1 Tax=Nonomuraea solani TaxID=1144553 RepID=A0A1H6EDY8_9ACTN|nr:acyl carrier protein [Nonomuraea solani]SEG95473.1 polyketide synthase PksL [Nonomuraea solani]